MVGVLESSSTQAASFPGCEDQGEKKGRDFLYFLGEVSHGRGLGHQPEGLRGKLVCGTRKARMGRETSSQGASPWGPSGRLQEGKVLVIPRGVEGCVVWEGRGRGLCLSDHLGCGDRAEDACGFCSGTRAHMWETASQTVSQLESRPCSPSPLCVWGVPGSHGALESWSHLALNGSWCCLSLLKGCGAGGGSDCWGLRGFWRTGLGVGVPEGFRAGIPVRVMDRGQGVPYHCPRPLGQEDSACPLGLFISETLASWQ